MGQAGRIEKVPMVECGCGYNGFETRVQATRYKLNRRAVGAEAEDAVECPHPKGRLWHVNDPSVKSRDEYIAMLTAGRRSVRARSEHPRQGAATFEPPPIREAARPIPSAPQLSRGIPAGCPTHKVGYASESRARVALEEAAQSNRTEVRTYECVECRRWHLTSATYAPDSIVEHEELVGDGFAVFAAKYPDGRLASLNFKNERGTVRVPAKFVPAVRVIIRVLLEEANEP